MSELDDALADVKQEGENPFVEVETETPASSPEVNEPEVVETLPVEEDSVPFHKHPRWIERENELKELKEHDAVREREIAELRTINETSRRDSADVPDWFSKLYGENPDAYRAWETQHEREKEDIKRSVIEDQQKAQREQADANSRYNKWVDDEINKLQADGKSFDRNELIKTMLDYRPTDDQGNFDFQKGYRIYEAMKPKDNPNSQARKQIADIATGSAKGEARAKDYMTPADLRNRSWSNL